MRGTRKQGGVFRQALSSETDGTDAQFDNDPSAGSPTETLLRLLLPLDSQVRPSSRHTRRGGCPPGRDQSKGLTKPSDR